MKGEKNINRPVVVNGTRPRSQVPLYSTYKYRKKKTIDLLSSAHVTEA